MEKMKCYSEKWTSEENELLKQIDEQFEHERQLVVAKQIMEKDKAILKALKEAGD